MRAKVVHVDAENIANLPIESEIIKNAGGDLICGGVSDEKGIISVAYDADVILTDSAHITSSIIKKLTICKAIICYGIGYDHIDTEAATKHGIFVVNLPGYCAIEVANHTVMFILACARKLTWLDRGMRQGKWLNGHTLETFISSIGSIDGEQLGLIGLGSIGRAVAVKAKGLGMVVKAFDPLIEKKFFSDYGVSNLDMDELIQTSDYVSLHVPINSANHNLINKKQLNSMKPSANLINTSRGALVDEKALIHALINGFIAGAALDVYVDEPLPLDSPLLKIENVILTPHVGGYSNDSFARSHRLVGEEGARILRGEMPTAIANPKVKGFSRLELG